MGSNAYRTFGTVHCLSSALAVIKSRKMGLFNLASYLHVEVSVYEYCNLDLILHEVKRASEASRSEMVEISHSLQLCMSFPTHIGKKKNFLPPSGTGVIQKCLCVCASVRLCVPAKKRDGASNRPEIFCSAHKPGE